MTDTLDIYRDGSVNITVKISDNTKLSQKLLGENIVALNENYDTVKDIELGDYIIINSNYYYVNLHPDIEKKSTREYKHTVTFEHSSYDLLRAQFLDANGYSDFPYNSDLDGFLDLIITNLNRIFSGWTKGTVDATLKDNFKLLSFKGENCLEVLQRLVDEYEGEFSFDSKEISFTDKIGSDSGLTFEYGKNKGLLEITRNSVTNENIITRLYAFGSERNLDSTYRNGAQRLMFETGGLNYIESNKATYGTIEHTKIFDHIYPHRTGTVTTVSGLLEFRDDSIDFDIKDYLIGSTTAKVHFEDGNIAGYDLELSNYIHTTHCVQLIQYNDDNVGNIPNTTQVIQAGDQYTFTDIIMPTTYITAAEDQLLSEAQTYLADNDEPKVNYNLVTDWRYFKDNSISLTLGDTVTIVDTDLNVNTSTRIVELTQCIGNEYKYTLKVSNVVYKDIVERLYADNKSVKNKQDVSKTGDVGRHRWNNFFQNGNYTGRVFQTDSGLPGHYKRLLFNKDGTLLWYDDSDNLLMTLGFDLMPPSNITGMLFEDDVYCAFTNRETGANKRAITIFDNGILLDKGGDYVNITGDGITIGAYSTNGSLIVNGNAKLTRPWFTGINIETLSGDKTLTTSSDTIQALDPNGPVTRDVLLPAEGSSTGLLFLFKNTGTQGSLRLRDDGDTNTIVTIGVYEGGIVFCDGTTWHGFMGAET